jgi:hypothetical protein
VHDDSFRIVEGLAQFLELALFYGCGFLLIRQRLSAVFLLSV